MFKKFAQVLAVTALLGASSAEAATANSVRGFVYEWFGLFDQNAPEGAFLDRLAPNGFEVAFPEATLRSPADFSAWYQGILGTFAKASHDVQSLAVRPEGDGWRVELIVEWRAEKFDGDKVQGLFNQSWYVNEDAATKLHIQRNRISPVAAQSDGSARYSPVRTLAEVPAGEPYGLVQPAVESPTLLQGKRIAIVTAPGVEDVELTYPLDYFTARGATVDVVAPWWATGRILGVDYTKPTFWINVDKTAPEALDTSYDLVIVTGGPWNSGVLRSDADVRALVERQFASGKLLAPVCSGSQILIDTGLASGRQVTGAPNIAPDLTNAGGTYLNQAVVRQDNLITGQDPRALPAFSKALADALLY